MAVDQLRLEIGDGDIKLEGAVTRSAPGGFSTKAELVIFRADADGLSAADAAKVIGSAKSAYHAGQQVLFVVADGDDSAVFLFEAAKADAKVSASELTLLATLDDTTSTHVSDFWFFA